MLTDRGSSHKVNGGGFRLYGGAAVTVGLSSPETLRFIGLLIVISGLMMLTIHPTPSDPRIPCLSPIQMTWAARTPFLQHLVYDSLISGLVCSSINNTLDADSFCRT